MPSQTRRTEERDLFDDASATIRVIESESCYTKTIHIAQAHKLKFGPVSCSVLFRPVENDECCVFACICASYNALLRSLVFISITKGG